MEELRLKQIYDDVDFRKSEETNFNALKKARKLPVLRKGEGVLFISKKKNQIVFVTPEVEFDSTNGVGYDVTVTVLASKRFRIRGSTWSPLMLANYAEAVGLTLQGIKRFEWHYQEKRKAQQAARQKAA